MLYETIRFHKDLYRELQNLEILQILPLGKQEYIYRMKDPENIKTIIDNHKK